MLLTKYKLLIGVGALFIVILSSLVVSTAVQAYEQQRNMINRK